MVQMRVVNCASIHNTFYILLQGETRAVHHLHFTSWPDHGVPITATALLNFRRKVRSYDNVATGPMIVHCRYF